ncbi:MAG TPA: HlyD family secretion protein [Planctomycetota bacterium]|nr:HlyD family secretion protein [Planctomycetota bacterium]
MKRKVLWIGGAIALAALAIGGWVKFSQKPDSTPQGGVATVKKGDYKITVTEEGTFQARKSVSLMVASQVFHQQMTITKIVDEGATVAKDEVLIDLDKGEIDRLISQAELDLQAEKNNVTQADADLNIQKEDNVVLLQRAEDDVKSAERDIRKWRELEAPKKIEEVNGTILDAKQAVKDQESEVSHQEQMFAKEFVSKQQVDKAKEALRKAKMTLKFAELSQKLLLEYDNPRETARLEVSLMDRQMYHKNRQVNLNSIVNQKQSALLRAQQSLRNKEDYLRKLREDRAAMTIKSPSDGIVLYGDPRQRYWGGQPNEMKVGGKINPHNPLLTIPDLTAYKVNLQVNEGDVNKVSPGLGVQIRPEAIPNTTFTGKVAKVSRVSGQQQWWANDGGSKFDVEIEMEGVDPRIRPGMKCKSEILIEDVKGVVHVPIDSIFEKKGETLCYVVASPPTERKVKTGRANQDVIEILEGLKEGERVTLFDPSRATK